MAEERCPSCGGPMEPGYLLAESLLGGAKWSGKRNRLGLGGEPLVAPDGLGNVYLKGSRCNACRRLSLRY